jgi:hypothetical protein
MAEAKPFSKLSNTAAPYPSAILDFPTSPIASEGGDILQGLLFLPPAVFLFILVLASLEIKSKVTNLPLLSFNNCSY